jgi:hypothetical protein
MNALLIGALLVFACGSAVADEPVVTATKADGPYPSIDALCREATSAERDFRSCRRRPTTCTAADWTSRVGPPFREARVMQFHGECSLALRTDAGWWLASPGEPLDRFLNNGERYYSQVSAISPTSDGALVIRGAFINWTNAEKMAWLEKPSHDEWYECEDRVVVCAVGMSGVACTVAIAFGYRTYCRDARRPEKPLHDSVRGVDFRLVPNVSRSKLQLDAKGGLPAGRPPTGFETPAIDRELLRDERGPLPPESVVLQFP